MFLKWLRNPRGPRQAAPNGHGGVLHVLNESCVRNGWCRNVLTSAVRKRDLSLRCGRHPCARRQRHPIIRARGLRAKHPEEINSVTSHFLILNFVLSIAHRFIVLPYRKYKSCLPRSFLRPLICEAFVWTQLNCILFC